MSDPRGETEAMRACMLCGCPTHGSVGAAGLRWSCICQPCKDAEDAALAASLTNCARVFDVVGTAVCGKGGGAA